MNRISCSQFLAILRQDAVHYEDLARKQAVRPRGENGNLYVDLYRDALTPATQQWLAAGPISSRELLALWLQAEIVLHGPKLFQPTLEQCLVLEQVAPRIASSDYAQPFPVMVVEFPERYRQQRSCPAQSEFFVGTHEPEGVIIGFAPPPVSALGVEVLFSSGNMIRSGITPGDTTIEERIAREFGEDSYADADPITVPERMVLAGAVRVAVNSMLLLAEFGCRSLGAANPAHHRRLEHFRDVARKHKRGLDDAERNLRFSSQLYGLAQEVVLHEDAGRGEVDGCGGEREGPRRPHWRRGHWKMHAFGVGRSERKRIFIKPVFVNRHLLHEQRSMATSYRIR